MTGLGWAQIALYFIVIAALTRPFGGFVYRVVTGERTWMSPVLRPVENAFYRLCGIDPGASARARLAASAQVTTRRGPGGC